MVHTIPISEPKEQEHQYKADAFILSSDSSVAMEWAKPHMMSAGAVKLCERADN
jgi:hypothetical protein